MTAARRFAVQTLADVPADLLETVELMVSELATNCVRHVGSAFEVTIDGGGDEIRIEVRDDGGGSPAIRSPTPDEPTGRGLRIVDVLSQDWGVRSALPAGKIVWFTVSRREGWHPSPGGGIV